MSSQWQATGATSVTVNAPTGAGGLVARVRALESSASAAGALTITDSVSGVVFTTTTAAFSQFGLDIRSSAGGALTIAQVNGTGVNAQGDFVPVGTPYGWTPQ